MASFDGKNFTTLEGANWKIWQQKADAYFRMNNLYDIVHGTEKAPATTETEKFADYKKRRRQAAGIIAFTISGDNAVLIEGKEDDPAAMWKELEGIHNAKSPGMRFNALSTLFSIEKIEGEDLCTYLTRATAAMNQYKACVPTDGSFTLANIQEELVVMAVLRHLPPEFNHIRSTLSVNPGLNLAITQQAFVAEDNQSKHQSEHAETALRASTHHHRHSTGPSSAPYVETRTCFRCGKQGHLKRNCSRPPQSGQGRHHRQDSANIAAETSVSPERSEAAFAANASTTPIPATARSNLNCDTGATSLMMGEERYFGSLRPLVRQIRIANGEYIQSKGEGDVIFQPYVNGSFSSEYITFPNVLFAPELQSNLIAVLMMVRKHGYEVSINSKQMEFYHGGTLRMTARIDDNYVAHLDGKVVTSESALAASTLPLDRSLWHRRLGHFHMAGIENIIRHDLVNDLRIESDERPDPICVPCLSGKQTRAVHTHVIEKSEELLHRVHADLHGPIHTEAFPGRSKYWMPLEDEASGFTYVTLLRTKGQAMEGFRNYKALVENQTGQKIKHLRDDKGGEFISKEFDDLCAKAGIQREHTNRATPEQNGMVERMNRRIGEGATALLAEANLPPSFWGLAVMAYVHVMNRCPSQAHAGRTPFEGFFNKKPSVKKLRVFGCAAYVHVQKDQRRALEPHTKKCVFVGYPGDRPGWMFWDIAAKKLIYSDSAEFDERSFPGTAMPREAAPDLLPDIPILLEPQQEDAEPPVAADPEPEAEAQEPPAILVGGHPIPQPAPAPAPAPVPLPIPVQPPPLTREIRQLHVHFEKLPENLPARRATKGRQPGAYVESPLDDEDAALLVTTAPVDDPKVSPLTPKQKSPPDPEKPEFIYIPVVDGVECALNTSTTSEPKTLEEALKRPDADKYLEAAIEEVKAHLENGTWEVVRLPQGKHAIGSRWVFKIKRNADGSIDRYKGRIVAKGYSQREGIDYLETFAPTARFGALRTVIALAALEDMELESVDIATAFLNGLIDAEVYMTKPDGVEIPGFEGSEWVLKLLKALYGIKQGPRCWNKKLHGVMMDLGFRRLECDHSVFVYEREGVRIIVPVHVDDLILASTSKEAIKKVKDELQTRFKLRDQGETKFILGVQLERDRKRRTIFLSQPTYIQNLLELYQMQDCNPADTPMAEKPRLSKKMAPSTPEEKDAMKNVPYREAVGKLLYLSIATRPDIAYAVSVLCRFNDDPGEEHWKAVKRVLRYLKGTQNYKLVYSPSGSEDTFVTHSDADLGGDVDNTRSTAGFVISVGGGAVLWSSRLQRQVTLSSTEAEYTTAAATGCEIMWMRDFFDEIGYDMSNPSTLFMDSASALQVAKNPEHQSTMKHVHRSYHWLRERVEEGDIKVVHVPGSDNVADIFTKPLGATKFQQCRALLGLRP